MSQDWRYMHSKIDDITAKISNKSNLCKSGDWNLEPVRVERQRKEFDKYVIQVYKHKCQVRLFETSSQTTRIQ